MEKASETKNEMFENSNRQIWLKQEAYKLRHQELSEDKKFVDEDRRQQLRLIEQKHELI